ncbi:unnamed protein product [Gongylonema pulchrum]|uniref:Uncharacterized protein n=1 Tax=Gongylonema pulchrum TaxID=637853 RepID=A0A3P7MX74_9BILA|nr:unnamed protein product [Gongylonema pulchrum]
MLAYQIAFDLYENASQQFINKIAQSLMGSNYVRAAIDAPTTSGVDTSTAVAAAAAGAATAPETTGPVPMETDEVKTTPAETAKVPTPLKSESTETAVAAVPGDSEEQKSEEKKTGADTEGAQESGESKKSEVMKSSDTATAAAVRTTQTASTTDNAQGSASAESKIKDKVVCERLRSILCGEQTIKHHMQFLIKNNHTDMLILKQTKESGHEANALKLLDPYLPKGEADQFGFKEGGSLYAYGKPFN